MPHHRLTRGGRGVVLASRACLCTALTVLCPTVDTITSQLYVGARSKSEGLITGLDKSKVHKAFDQSF